MFRIRIRTLIRKRVKIMIPKLTIIMTIKITAKRGYAFIFFYISACAVLSTIQMKQYAIWNNMLYGIICYME